MLISFFPPAKINRLLHSSYPYSCRMKIIRFAFLFLSVSGFAQTKILFDASKAQMCSNADWVIDADVFNLGLGTGGIMEAGQSNEANPGRYPTPTQSGITQSTAETYWDGALSAWAVDLVKLGYEVETLPYSGSITYGNSSNEQDLSHYKVFISDEPNIRFTTAEKTAILQFVQNGGGLFMIADHDVSDRNFDGWDSPHIWNSLMDTNTVQARAFGITFDYQNFNQTSSNVATIPTDSCLHNSLIGNVSQIKISGGTSITIDHTNNSSARGLIYKTGATTTGSTQILLASARFGTGRVAALSDSSPPDDGTGDPNDQNLYFSYTGEANGSHRIMLLNTTIWLATTAAPLAVDEINNEETTFEIYPNPVHAENLQVKINDVLLGQKLTVVSTEGKIVFSENIHANLTTIPFSEFSTGIYFLKIGEVTKKLVHLF